MLFLFGMMGFITAPGGVNTSSWNTTCTDSDEGKDYYVKGSSTVTDKTSDTTIYICEDTCALNVENIGIVIGYESCSGDNCYLKECYCEGNMDSYKYSKCTKDCEDGACIEEETDKDNETSDKICCHKFGYGAGMEIVNSKYQYINREDCVAPEGFVGGGREIVDNGLCEQYKNTIRTENRIKASYTNQLECPEDCTCAGSTVKCQIEGGRQMTVYAGKSGNMIVQIKGVNMSTKVELYKNENGTLTGVFKGKNKTINITPDQVQERVRERLRQRTCECEEIELDDDGIYQVQAKKRARLFFLIPVREKVKAQIDSETGEMIRVRTSWWGFLARDIKEES